jgi:membrane-bound serine protease (ClpP class)
MVDPLYAFLIDPNVVFMLFVVAMIGIFLEIVHPGAILPGVTGAIALLLFLFAVGSLTPNWAGLALMALAFVLLILDVQLPTHGVLTVGAVISLVIGAFLFFGSSTSSSGPQLSPIVVYALAAVVGVLGFTLATVAVRAQHNPIPSGVEAMIGARAVTLTPLLPEGRVRYAGEDWAAILDIPYTSLDAGAEVQIVSVNGLRVHVQPIHALMEHENRSFSS